MSQPNSQAVHPGLELQLKKIPYIPVVVIQDPEAASFLADALLKAQISIIEITCRTDAAFDAIKKIKQSHPEILVGAGTVLFEDQLKYCMDIGAEFAVAPGFNPRMVQFASSHQFPFYPGVLTPSEIEHAIHYGCTHLKYFPAEPNGGITMLKSIISPYANQNLRFIPTGGITPKNIASYMEAKEVMGCGVSYPVKEYLISEAKWDTITQHCMELHQALGIHLI